MTTMNDYTLGRVYFQLSSKHGEASLGIDHWPARQMLILPAHPSSAIEDALPLLHAPVAHYASQWQELDIDYEDRDSAGFSVPGDEMPDGICDPTHASELLTIARRHAGPELQAQFRDTGKVLYEAIQPPHDSNIDEVSFEAEFSDLIERWRPR